MIPLELDPTKSETTGVRVGAPFEELDTFLAHDLRVVRNISDTIDALKKIASGAAPPEIRSGNAWVMIPDAAMTKVETLFAEPPTAYAVPTRELIDLLERWKALVLEHFGDDVYVGS